MQHLIRINAIEARAHELKTTLSGLCRRAGVVPSTVLRWRSGAVDPGILLFEEVAGRLEAELDKVRKELAEAIKESAA
jgi:transcriptional regulator with XRE-family HTH domain